MAYQYTGIVLNPKTAEFCELWIDWQPDADMDLNLYLAWPGNRFAAPGAETLRGGNPGNFGRAYVSLRQTRDVNYKDYVRSHSPGGLDDRRQGEAWGFVLYTCLALMAYSANFDGIFSATTPRTPEASKLWGRLVKRGLAELNELDDGELVWTYDSTTAGQQGILLHLAEGPLHKMWSEEMLDNFPALDALLNVRVPKDVRARDWLVRLLVSRGATLEQIGEWAALNDLRSVQLPLSLEVHSGYASSFVRAARDDDEEEDDEERADSQQAFAFNGAEVRPHVTPARRRAIEAAWHAAYGDLEDMP